MESCKCHFCEYLMGDSRKMRMGHRLRPQRASSWTPFDYRALLATLPVPPPVPRSLKDYRQPVESARDYTLDLSRKEIQYFLSLPNDQLALEFLAKQEQEEIVPPTSKEQETKDAITKEQLEKEARDEAEYGYVAKYRRRYQKKLDKLNKKIAQEEKDGRKEDSIVEPVPIQKANPTGYDSHGDSNTTATTASN